MRIIRNPRPVSTAQALAVYASYLEVVGDGNGKLVRRLPSVYHDGHGTFPDNTPPMDCVGFALSRGRQVPRHRPGYNKDLYRKLVALGYAPELAKAFAFVYDVEDDVNVTSMFGDALADQDLVRFVSAPEMPEPGDFVAYPTVKLEDHPGKSWEGHIGGVVDVDPKFDPFKPDYRLLQTVQCTGPEGHDPGVISMNGLYFQEHAEVWPLPQHTTRILRVVV